MVNSVVYIKPYDAEIEYLESTGTQYIDTGIIATNNTRIDTGFLRNYGTYNICIIGARPSTYKVNEFAVRPYIDGRFTFIYGNTEGTLNSSSVKNATYYQCVTNGGFMRLYDSDGNQLQGVQAANNTFTTQYTLYMFVENRGGTVAENSGRKLRIYYLKIYDNTTLVRDFIPVRVGSVGYMYDKVSGQLFGNAGTGNFVLGQDVANPVPNIRRVFRFGNKRFVMPMPYDSKVEYLESTGIQYIYIPFTLNKGDNTYCSVYVTETELTNSDAIFMSSMGSRNKYGLVFKNRRIWLSAFADNGVSDKDIYFDYNVWQNVSIIYNASRNKYTFNVDNTNLASQTPAYNRVSGIYLFCRNNLLENAAKARISSLKIKRNGNYILDLIPVRRGNVGYLYDKVSGKLFGNAGTGQFNLGNDIND